MSVEKNPNVHSVIKFQSFFVVTCGPPPPLKNAKLLAFLFLLNFFSFGSVFLGFNDEFQA